MPPGSLVMPGSYGKAATVALTEALDELAADDEQVRKHPGFKPDPERDAFIQCYLRPESYDVYVGFEKDRYIVRVLPISERCVSQGAEVLDGGGTYEVDAKTFAILKGPPERRLLLPRPSMEPPESEDRLDEPADTKRRVGSTVEAQPP